MVSSDCRSQVCRLKGGCAPAARATSRLESFSQFGGKCATRLIPAVGPFLPVRALLGSGAVGGGGCGSGDGSSRCTRSVLPFGRLSRVGAEEAVFEGSAVETADDGLHLIGGGRFDESETLGLLGFVIANYFDGVGHEVFSGKPLLDVVSSDPGG